MSLQSNAKSSPPKMDKVCGLLLFIVSEDRSQTVLQSHCNNRWSMVAVSFAQKHKGCSICMPLTQLLLNWEGILQTKTTFVGYLKLLTE